jgi:hypothetical protein
MKIDKLPSSKSQTQRRRADEQWSNQCPSALLLHSRKPTKSNTLCKQRGIKLATLQSSGVFDPRGIRQLAVQARPLGSLLAGIKNGVLVGCIFMP